MKALGRASAKFNPDEAETPFGGKQSVCTSLRFFSSSLLSTTDAIASASKLRKSATVIQTSRFNSHAFQRRNIPPNGTVELFELREFGKAS